MPEFLSHEWIESLDTAAAELTIDSELSVVIEQRVDFGGSDGSDGSDGSAAVDKPVTWHVSISDGRASVQPGRADPDRAPIVFSCDLDTARSIAAGRASAQRLFLEGRLRLEGDVGRLLSARSALEIVGEALAGVRSDTTGLDEP